MKINLKLNKKVIFLSGVVVWVIFSIWYVLNDQWQDFKIGEREQAYRIGKEEVIKAVVEQTSACQQQLPLSYENKTVNVISVECLQKQQEAPAQQAQESSVKNLDPQTSIQQ